MRHHVEQYSPTTILLAILAALTFGFGLAIAFKNGYQAVAKASAPDVAWCEEDNGSCKDVCKKNDTTVVVFHAEWCPACKEMEQKTLSDPAVRQALSTRGAVRVDVDKNPRLSESAGIRTIPTTVILNRQCREIGRANGALPPDAFISFLEGTEKANK